VSAIQVLGLDHVVLRIRDLEASLRFYCDALGCSEERRLEELGLVQLRAGSALIDLVPVDSPLGKAGGGAVQTEGRNMDHFALQLESFYEPAIREQLEQSGVPASAVGDVGQRYGAEGTGPSLYVKDPDGNVVELKGPPKPLAD